MKIQDSHHLPANGPALLIWHQLPTQPMNRLGSINGRRLIFVEPTETDPRTLIESSLAGGEVVVLRASPLTSGFHSLGRLSELATLGLSIRNAVSPPYPTLAVVQDPLAGVTRIGSAFLQNLLTSDSLRRRLYDLSEQAFRYHPALEISLGQAALTGLKKRFFAPLFIDGFLEGRIMTGGKLLAASWMLADWLRVHVRTKRVGLVLPTGISSAIANTACVLAGFVPVNFNYTAGRLANEAAINRSGVEVVLTIDAFKSKLGDFPWPEATVDLKKLLLGFPQSLRLRRFLQGLLLPVEQLISLIGVPRGGGDNEAVLLFTSGSDGQPKGVVLTHRNILANITQIDSVLAQTSVKRILACLPIFHSFGSTVTLWWPILGGPCGVTYIKPMETVRLIELIEKYQVDLLLNTPTFLRNFLRKAQPSQLRSLKLVVTGAEKLPPSLRQEFETKFAVPVCEGYGMTEASPVVAVNMVDFAHCLGTLDFESPRRCGSVGRLLPGISVKITSDEGSDELTLDQSGLIWFKGANIFPGYWEDPQRTQEVLIDGWYCTGDYGRVDEEGFLFIEGRRSRFSKIAGEMVPHGVVESMILEAFRPKFGEEFEAVIVSVSDATKGEALIVLSTFPLEIASVKAALSLAGLPNLWFPREVRQIIEIPQLATGKLDLAACRRLVNEPGI